MSNGQASSSSNQESKAMWGGRFKTRQADSLRRFTESVSFDWRLYPYDIAGSIAHAKMLLRIGVLNALELSEIIDGLGEIEREIDAGTFGWSIEREDVHMNIEAALTRKTAAGAKLHTARSRNDQVATDMRLWLRDQIDDNIRAATQLQSSLEQWALRDVKVIIPGYTHLQRAQPVLLAHHLLAYVEMLERDIDRLRDCRKRADVLPLGSGAIAGTTLPLDREFVARLLNFSGITANSMDATTDRDFVVEYCSGCALLAVHLSRLAEDLVLWSTAEFGFIRIGDAFTTGSSLMPQKKNPDIAEIVRGKSGRVIGNLVSLLTMLKGLPMTYNRDLQEDKESLFDTADTVQLSLEIMAEMLGDVKVNAKACAAAASDPLLLATDLADWLVDKGMPFRQAHEVVGRAVALAEEKQMPISKLPLGDLKKLSDLIDADALTVFDKDKALRSRTVPGAPNPSTVRERLLFWQKKLHDRLEQYPRKKTKA